MMGSEILSEIRIDPITGRHVIFAKDRDLRPTDLWNKVIDAYRLPDVPYTQECPFCIGNENQTPPEILRIPDEKDWKIRVVPNKYPALESSADDMLKIQDRVKTNSLFEKYSGIGTHEVIVESPYHNDNYFNMSSEDFGVFMEVMYERYCDIISNPAIDFVSFFKNYQKLAGASLFHPHSQIIGLGSVPDFVRYEVEGANKYFHNSITCPYCDILKVELKKKERLVYENDEFAVICPFAPKYKYEVWVLPKKHKPFFETEDNVKSLADALHRAMKMLNAVIGDFPFNMYLHALPKSMKDSSSFYHYHFEINPRISGNAGFELGTGIYINSIFPEDAACNIKSEYEKIKLNN